MLHIYKRTMPKHDFNKVAKQLFKITLQHRCSPVNLMIDMDISRKLNDWTLFIYKNLFRLFSRKDEISWTRKTKASYILSLFFICYLNIHLQMKFKTRSPKYNSFVNISVLWELIFEAFAVFEKIYENLSL